MYKRSRTMMLMVNALALLISFTPLISGISVRYNATDECGSDVEPSGGTIIKKDFISSDTITRMNFSNMDIVYIENGAFEKLPKLSYLELQGNKISAEHLFSLGEIPKLSYLILRDQDNKNLKRCSTRMTTVYDQLRLLDLKNTAFNGILSDVESPFPNLKHLDLSLNGIQNIDFINTYISNSLRYLFLTENELKQVSLKKFVNLQSLNLNKNKIQVIGDNSGLDLTGLTQLTSFTVAENQISTIHKGAFKDTKNLLFLNISMNFLSIIDADVFDSLNILLSLTLDYNLLEVIPPTTATMNINTLSMNNNRIKYLNANGLVNLPNLIKLSLAGNMISNVDADTFRNQKQLQELYLNDNQLSHLPRGWNSFTEKLQYLNLSGNKFTLIDSVFDFPYLSLTTVYFDRNPIEYIQTSIFQRTNSNVTIYLRSDENSSAVTCKNS